MGKGFISTIGLVLAGLVIIFAGYFLVRSQSSTINPSLIPQEQRNSASKEPYVKGGDKLFYVSFPSASSTYDSDIEVFDTQTAATSTFLKDVRTDFIAFSNNGRYLFYNEIPNFDEGGDPSDTKLYEYDFVTRTSAILATGYFISVESISPNNVYLVADTGCCPGNRGRIFINIETKKVILRTTGQAALWSPNGTKCALSRGSVELGAFDQSIYSNSIYVLSMQSATTSEQLLLRASLADDYIPITWSNDNSLVYSKKTYNPPFPPSEEVQRTGIFDSNYWSQVRDNSPQAYYQINTNTLVISPAVAQPSAPILAQSVDAAVQEKHASPSGEWTARYQYDPTTHTTSAYVVDSANGSKRVELGATTFLKGFVWQPIAGN